MNQGIFKLNLGQTLIEVVLAVSVTVLVLVLLVSAVTRSLANSQFAKNKSVAAKLVEEGLETARRDRDRALNWTDFNTQHQSGQTYRLGSDLAFAAGACNENTLNLGIFSRCAVFTDESSSKKRVTIIVYWKDGSGIHQTQGLTYLTDWK